MHSHCANYRKYCKHNISFLLKFNEKTSHFDVESDFLPADLSQWVKAEWAIYSQCEWFEADAKRRPDHSESIVAASFETECDVRESCKKGLEHTAQMKVGSQILERGKIRRRRVVREASIEELHQSWKNTLTPGGALLLSDHFFVRQPGRIVS